MEEFIRYKLYVRYFRLLEFCYVDEWDDNRIELWFSISKYKFIK